MNKRTKNLVFSVIMVAFVVIIIELSAYVFFRVFEERFTFYDPRNFVATDTVIRYAHQRFHPQRGWDNTYDTPHGERPRQVDYGQPYIATFGDSYTHCDEVGHHETWQEYLSRLIKKDVYNFGVGGYGTDQAYMKFVEMYPKDISTRIVILGLVSENINRLVSVYRPFYFSKTGLRLTKPRFKMIDGCRKLIENPIQTEGDLEKLKDVETIEEIGRHDFWFNRERYPVFRFPFTRILFNRKMWMELVFQLKGHQIDDKSPRPWVDLWQDKEAVGIMFSILDSFVARVEAEQAVPIILVLPTENEVAAKVKTGVHPAGAKVVEEYCKQKGYHYFNPMDAFVAYAAEGNDLNDLYHGHMSRWGNKMVAHGLYRYLQETLPDQ